MRARLHPWARAAGLGRRDRRDPDDVMRIFPETYAVGAQFGVVLVPYERQTAAKRTIEVATFRSDGAYSDGRHPDEVRFAKTPQEDVQRRDFTINGMLLDPLDGDKVLDFVGGREDIEAGVIRTIGEPERRFGEDKLRMLRAVRFAARFGYEIEPRDDARNPGTRAEDPPSEPRACAR